MPTWEQICARRTARHGIFAPLDTDISGAVAAMCGAHAQVLSAAELSIGLRLPVITRSDVTEALWSSRTLVKAYGPRGTVHLLPTADLPMWVGALSSIPHRSGLRPQDRLTSEQTDAVVAAIGDVVATNEVTLDELNDEIVRRAGSWAADLTTPDFGGFAPRWRQALGIAASRGVVCFGAGRGRNVTYARPPEFRPIDSRTAVKMLVARYLRAYGPTYPADFAKWLAAPAGWAEEAFGGFEQIDCGYVDDGDDVWLEEADTTVRLLPYFDAYTVGVQPRDLAFKGADRALAHGQAGAYPVLLIGGVVCGIWHQRRSGRKLTLTVEPFVRLSRRSRHELDEQVERVSAIMEATASMALGQVTVQAHR